MPEKHRQNTVVVYMLFLFQKFSLAGPFTVGTNTAGNAVLDPVGQGILSGASNVYNYIKYERYMIGT